MDQQGQVFSRPPDDEAELDAWADGFAARLLETRERILKEGHTRTADEERTCPSTHSDH